MSVSATDCLMDSLCSKHNQTSDLLGNFVILWLVSFDPKFSPCSCTFWLHEVSLEILSGADECIYYRLLDGLQFFHWSCFQIFFFRLKRTGSSSFTLLAKYRKKNYNEIVNQIVALSKTEGLFVGYFCKIISHSNNLV